MHMGMCVHTHTHTHPGQPTPRAKFRDRTLVIDNETLMIRHARLARLPGSCFKEMTLLIS